MVFDLRLEVARAYLVPGWVHCNPHGGVAARQPIVDLLRKSEYNLPSTARNPMDRQASLSLPSDYSAHVPSDVGGNLLPGVQPFCGDGGF
jgi:hypothetical protein